MQFKIGGYVALHFYCDWIVQNDRSHAIKCYWELCSYRLPHSTNQMAFLVKATRVSSIMRYFRGDTGLSVDEILYWFSTIQNPYITAL